jgi:hypothetical protein
VHDGHAPRTELHAPPVALGIVVRLSIPLVVAALGLLVAPEAGAVIIRHDVDDAEYVVPDADYPALVDLIEPGDCIGTLIDPSWLLTVAHCAVDLEVGATLLVSGSPHAVAEVVLHPSWQDADAYDIALVRLADAVTEVDPFPLYRGSEERGAVVTLVGRGVTATGLEGERGGDTDGKLRRATNVVTAVDDHFIEVAFERAEDEGVTPLEGVGAAGDSGCPVFIDVDGVRWIAGLNAWGDGGDGIRVGQYGARDYQTRVSRYLDWIDEVMPPTQEDADARRGCSTTGRASPMCALLLLLFAITRRGSPRPRST